MFAKPRAKLVATNLKRSVDEVHQKIDALPDGPAKDEAKAAFDKLHARLNWVAHQAAEHYDDDVETFSGGTDRPTTAPTP